MPDLSLLGAASGGVWTRGQALELASAGVVRGAVRRSWQVVWPGVHADAGYELTAEQRCWAAVLASGGAGQPVPIGVPDPVTGEQRRRVRAVACGRTAARFWGLPLVDDDDPATGGEDRLVDEVAVGTHLRTVHDEGRVLHRYRLSLAPQDITRTASGLFVTSPLRTLLDLCGLLTAEAAVCAVDDGLHRRLVHREQLWAVVRPGAPGSAGLLQVLGRADGRAESPGETLTRLVLQPVLPALEPQVVLRDARGRAVARFDLGDRARRLAVESDGKTAHAGASMVAKDRARDLRAERLGWWTERVTWYDVRRRQEQTRRRVLDRAAWLDGRPLDVARPGDWAIPARRAGVS